MRNLLTITLMALLSLTLLVACGDTTTEPIADLPTPELSDPLIAPTETAVVEEATTQPQEEEMSITIPDELQELTEEIMSDLSQRATVNQEAITITEVEAVTWNDGSLGCPEPDMMYTMALEPGYRLVLTTDGKEFHYHTRGTASFIYCENPPENGTTPNDR